MIMDFLNTKLIDMNLIELVILGLLLWGIWEITENLFKTNTGDIK